MSLILKQEPANTIATPPAGKSTLFVNDNSVMSVKSPDGNVTTFPTVQGANTQVLFNDNGALSGNANLVFNKTSATKAKQTARSIASSKKSRQKASKQAGSRGTGAPELLKSSSSNKRILSLSLSGRKPRIQARRCRFNPANSFSRA